MTDLFKGAALRAPFYGSNAEFFVACKSLLALVVQGKAVLIEINETGAAEEKTPELPFVSLGSGAGSGDAFLAFLRRVLWPERQPTVAEGRLVAAWTVKHVSETATGGIGGSLQMATLTVCDGKPSIEFCTEEDRGEHDQFISSAEAALREHVQQHGSMPEEAEVPVLNES